MADDRLKEVPEDLKPYGWHGVGLRPLASEDDFAFDVRFERTPVDGETYLDKQGETVKVVGRSFQVEEAYEQAVNTMRVVSASIILP